LPNRIYLIKPIIASHRALRSVIRTIQVGHGVRSAALEERVFELFLERGDPAAHREPHFPTSPDPTTSYKPVGTRWSDRTLTLDQERQLRTEPHGRNCRTDWPRSLPPRKLRSSHETVAWIGFEAGCEPEAVFSRAIAQIRRWSARPRCALGGLGMQ
jgi:hypothetical protein